MTKIETFLILAKTAKGAAMVALINDVLAASDIYQFGELLDCPNVQALKDSDLHSHYMALYHFAYGNLTTYYKDPSLPKLNDIQLRKLKQLTLVALAERKVLKYDNLLKDLDIPNVRQLEDIIIASIYSNIIQGKLDQKNKCFIVESTIGRDLKPEDTGLLLEKLTTWSVAAQNLLSQIESKQSQVGELLSASAATKAAYEKELKTAIQQASNSKDEKIIYNRFSKEQQFRR